MWSTWHNRKRWISSTSCEPIELPCLQFSVPPTTICKMGWKANPAFYASSERVGSANRYESDHHIRRALEALLDLPNWVVSQENLPSKLQNTFRSLWDDEASDDGALREASEAEARDKKVEQQSGRDAPGSNQESLSPHLQVFRFIRQG